MRAASSEIPTRPLCFAPPHPVGRVRGGTDAWHLACVIACASGGCVRRRARSRHEAANQAADLAGSKDGGNRSMDSLDPKIIIGILIALAVVVIAFVLMRKRRTD